MPGRRHTMRVEEGLDAEGGRSLRPGDAGSRPAPSPEPVRHEGAVDLLVRGGAGPVQPGGAGIGPDRSVVCQMVIFNPYVWLLFPVTCKVIALRRRLRTHLGLPVDFGKCYSITITH